VRAIIIGHSGQDGTLLCESLEKKGYGLIGLSRNSILTIPERNLEKLPKVEDNASISDLIKNFQPTEIYYLAAYHTSSEVSDDIDIRESFVKAEETHVIGLLNVLCAIRDYASNCKLFYASSSLVFSGEDGEIQDEETALSPSGFYGITKAQAMRLCKEFSEKYNVFASVGILYNHESCLRAPHFLTKKIILSAINAASGSKKILTIGDLSAKVDWSYAPDFIEAFQLILKTDKSDTFIIASGEVHTVQEFVEIVYDYFQLDWREYVVEDSSILARRPLVKTGNPSKLISATGWKRSFDFLNFVKQLVVDTVEKSVN